MKIIFGLAIGAASLILLVSHEFGSYVDDVTNDEVNGGER